MKSVCTVAVGALAIGGWAVPSSLAQTCEPEHPSMLTAIEHAAAKSDHPRQTRTRLLERIIFSPTCYPGDLTQEQLDQLMAATQLLPPGVRGGFGPRYLTDNSAWTGAGQIGVSNASHAAQLTYSFPDDGVTWGLTCSGFNTGANDLNAKLTATFGSIDRGREMIRSAIAAWRAVGALSYTEVADDDSAEDNSTTHVSTRGDIRIGGYGFGALGTSPLAYNSFPNSPLTQCNGGDMAINTIYFTGAYLSNVNGNFLYLRNTAAHEHGHGLGFYHTVPCNQTKLMEPTITTTGISTVMPDEVRAVIRDYGDRFNAGAGNHTYATAKDFGNLTTPAVQSVIQRNLGLNGTAIAEEDWFKFTIDSPQSVTISVTPTGYAPMGACCVGASCTLTTQATCATTWFVAASCGSSPCAFGSCCTGSGCSIVSYGACSGSFLQGGSCNGSVCVAPGATVTCAASSSDQACCQGNQTTGCTGTSAIVNAQNAGNLALELRSGANASVVTLSSNSQNLGVVESVTSAALPAGTYWVRVWDSGGGVGWSSNNQTVQTYDLVVRVGTSKAPPFAIAGLQHKRVMSDSPCQFIGNHNSYATEPGASIPSGNYVWDLDGDGTFETTSQTQPQITYRSNGTYNVTLRITDSNNMSATDTIQVQVYGATTSITNVSPNSGVQGTTVPVTIVGSNFKGVTSASQISAVNGITVTGTPVVNGLGTRITGLSFTIASGAPLGARDVSVTNSDGLGASATGTGVFTVNTAVTTGACCPPSGVCSITTPAACTDAFQGLGTVCSPNLCPQPNIACCAADGSCTFITAAQCTGGTAQGYGSVCTPNPCPQPSVACCAADGSCTFVTAASCSGAAMGLGSVCSPNPCPQPTGACCAGATCAVRTAAACAGAHTRFAGLGVACNPPTELRTPCCVADFNQDGVLNTQDIFDYLNGWFASDSATDFGGDGISVQDIFDYLNAYFTGC
jgi:hypothetical protein